jgi:parallel beta-helix repeat protein
MGGSAVGFLHSKTTGIILSECEFFDFIRGIEIIPYGPTDIWNTCDRVLIERCRFSGDMGGYPIHFGGEPSRLAATNVDVKNCIIIGPNKWFLHNSGGSADQIVLYGVKHFSVTGNVSNNGGDGGIVIQNSKYGIVSGNKCEGNFGPGIIISPGDFINVNGNACSNNCRRRGEKVGSIGVDGCPITSGETSIGAVGGISYPAGIWVQGSQILITNNLCFDNTRPSSPALQNYGLAIYPGSKNIVVGPNFFYGTSISGSGGDIYPHFLLCHTENSRILENT